MSVPHKFVGAWERVSLTIDGRAVDGIGQAVWLEAGGTYADVRAPGSVASDTAFAGRSHWRSPRFTWHHDIDLHPRRGAIDRGELTLDGDIIEERGYGIDGSSAPYVEHWRRITPVRRDEIEVHTTEQRLTVRVGDHAAIVSHRGAGLWVRNARGKWTAAVSLGRRERWV